MKLKQRRARASGISSARSVAPTSPMEKTPPLESAIPTTQMDSESNRPMEQRPQNLSSADGPAETSDAVEEIIVDPMLGPTPEQIEAAAQEQVMSPEQFREFHASLYPLAGHLLGAVRPPPWQSLIQAPTIPTFGPASDALYRMAMRYPWLRFLIDPSSEWLKDMAIVLSFGSSVAVGVYSEIRGREEERLAHVKRPVQPTEDPKTSA
jgi:hypothetical protein